MRVTAAMLTSGQRETKNEQKANNLTTGAYGLWSLILTSCLRKRTKRLSLTAMDTNSQLSLARE